MKREALVGLLTRRAAISLIPSATISACILSSAPSQETQVFEDTFSTDAILPVLGRLDAGSDMRTGGADEQAIAEMVTRHLNDAGFSVSMQSVSVPSFEARKTQLGWDGGNVEVFPQYPVLPTSAAGLQAPLRIWNDETDSSSMPGAIALVMLPRVRHSNVPSPAIAPRLQAVADAGAAAIVLVTDGPTGETIRLNAAPHGPVAPVTVAVLGPKPGAGVLAAARNGKEGRLVIDGAVRQVTSSNVIGRIDRGGPWLIVSTPRTGWTRTVAERGPGLAAFFALAAWAPRAIGKASLLFVNTTAHEFENEGGHRFLADAATPKPDNTALWAHLGAGFAARAHHDLGGYRQEPLPSVDPQRFVVASDVLIERLKAVFKGQPGLEQVYPAAGGAGGELGEILAAGYSPAFGLLAAHLYHHIEADRIGLTDPDWIRAATLSVRDGILGYMTQADLA